MFETKQEAAAYLAAMIDGEGTIGAYGKNKLHARRVSVCNTDYDLIEACAKCCEMLDIPYRIYQSASPARPSHWKPRWDLKIATKVGFERLLAVVPLQCKRKLIELKRIVEGYRDRQPIPTKELLEELYFGKEQSFLQIRQALGAKSLATVRGWFDHYSIPRRTMSEAVSLAWREGRRVANSVSE